MPQADQQREIAEKEIAELRAKLEEATLQLSAFRESGASVAPVRSPSVVVRESEAVCSPYLREIKTLQRKLDEATHLREAVESRLGFNLRMGSLKVEVVSFVSPLHR
jgi:hypothetical protein